jgi:hypothetical protein
LISGPSIGYRQSSAAATALNPFNQPFRNSRRTGIINCIQRPFLVLYFDSILGSQSCSREKGFSKILVARLELL